jgi:hypothetical protein
VREVRQPPTRVHPIRSALSRDTGPDSPGRRRRSRRPVPRPKDPMPRRTFSPEGDLIATGRYRVEGGSRPRHGPRQWRPAMWPFVRRRGEVHYWRRHAHARRRRALSPRAPGAPSCHPERARGARHNVGTLEAAVPMVMEHLSGTDFFAQRLCSSSKETASAHLPRSATCSRPARAIAEGAFAQDHPSRSQTRPNLFLTRRADALTAGEGYRFKLSKARPKTRSTFSLTNSGIVVGSPHCMSPGRSH